MVIAIVTSVRVNVLLIKILLIPLGLAMIVLRSLWVEFPSRTVLRYDDAPRLFDLAKSLREATNGPRLHKILLTDEFNAAIVQRPRLGLFGWQENYLMVGLPLLRGLSPDEVQAVIAHEFGHLSGQARCVFGMDLSRSTNVGASAYKAATRAPASAPASSESFFKWYAPYFTAYCSCLTRASMKQIVRRSVAAKKRGAHVNQERVERQALADEFWPEVFPRRRRK